MSVQPGRVLRRRTNSDDRCCHQHCNTADRGVCSIARRLVGLASLEHVLPAIAGRFTWPFRYASRGTAALPDVLHGLPGVDVSEVAFRPRPADIATTVSPEFHAHPGRPFDEYLPDNSPYRSREATDNFAAGRWHRHQQPVLVDSCTELGFHADRQSGIWFSAVGSSRRPSRPSTQCRASFTAPDATRAKKSWTD
jgi:hypothetical protein